MVEGGGMVGCPLGGGAGLDFLKNLYCFLQKQMPQMLTLVEDHNEASSALDSSH